MRIRHIVTAFLLSVVSGGTAVGQNATIDQATWDLVDVILKKKLPWSKVLLVQQVTLTNVAIKPDVSRKRSVRGEPTTSQFFNAVNCTPREQLWKRDIDYVTTIETTVEMEKTVTTTETVQVEAGGSLFGLVNSKATYTNEEQVKVNEKQTQVFKSVKTVTVTEERKIPPNTRLFVRVVEKLETTTFPLVGTGIVDAQLSYKLPISIGPEISGPTWLSAWNMIPMPKDRLVDLEGLATIGTNETIDVVYEERAVDPGDPACNVVDPPDLKSFSG